MTIEPVASAQIRVFCETDADCYDLRYYSADEFLVPQWWIGVSDSTGELKLTAVSPGSGRTPAAVRSWLERTVEPQIAERLIQMATDAIARLSVGRESVGSGR